MLGVVVSAAFAAVVMGEVVPCGAGIESGPGRETKITDSLRWGRLCEGMGA